jgi:membrane-associated protease RseP (regulator of RpoE activity)
LPYPPAGPVRPSWGPDDVVQSPPFEAFFVPPPRPKFRHRWWLHIVLFLLTLLSTTVVGAGHYLSYASDFGRQPVALQWRSLLDGLYYSLSILAILGAHEMGHYIACRRYNVDATLPFFIPAPFITGTLGAVIRIREPFPTKVSLFDMAVAGPLAGFVVLIPLLFLGLYLSPIVVIPTNIPLVNFGEPLLFKLGMSVMFGPIPQGQGINMHPIVFATWFGMLATAWNLLPFGQMDGGHIAHATLGRWSFHLSIATVIGAIAMSTYSMSWWFMTAVMIIMLFLFGARHAPVLYNEPLPASRQAIALLALVVLIICFIPVPIEELLPSK